MAESGHKCVGLSAYSYRAASCATRECSASEGFVRRHCGGGSDCVSSGSIYVRCEGERRRSGRYGVHVDVGDCSDPVCRSSAARGCIDRTF